MTHVKPRPSSIPYGIVETHIKDKINRIEMYRTQNAWWQRIWKPKYNIHMLALTDKAIYHLCENCNYKFPGEKQK